jgi:hypothetical protein
MAVPRGRLEVVALGSGKMGCELHLRDPFMSEDHPGSPEPADPRALGQGGPESTFHLINLARAGDREALERLFARHLKPLQSWARGRLPGWARDLADTDDLVQDTLVQTSVFIRISCANSSSPVV